MKIKLTLGIMFIVLGIAMFCTEFGIMKTSDLSSIIWPLVLICTGAQRLYKKNNFNIGAAIMILFGILFEVEAFHILSNNIYEFIAPGMLIIIGASRLSRMKKTIND
ncbi:LiaF transmembrane domain-containing protein [Clostridium neuense]|uniref:LiaF transmembrane domain-containing protein n=1 Tax=Clostridium neuense TaxID=1728934 RepID=A0ABW8TM82_9CLOT